VIAVLARIVGLAVAAGLALGAYGGFLVYAWFASGPVAVAVPRPVPSDQVAAAVSPSFPRWSQ
jgi:uncharacterized protein (DUF58 family)